MKLRNKLNNEFDFVKNTIIKVPRTTFFRHQKHITTFDAGKLIPLHIDEVVPGDTFDMSMSSIVRMNSPLLKPILDNAEFQVWAFFVPMRLVENQWEQIIGGFQPNPDWSTDNNVTMSQLTIPSGGFATASVADYFGVPVGQGDGETINQAPFRAYALIWDNWFRDENLMNSIMVNTQSGITTMGVNNINGEYITDAVLGGALCPVSKIHDYFTSCLPAPQKGEPSTIGIGSTAPVIGTGNALGLTGSYSGSIKDFGAMWLQNDYQRVAGRQNMLNQPVGTTSSGGESFQPNDASAIGVSTNPDNSGLIADLSESTGISINDLRYAFQLQMIKEADARYGTRYRETLLGHYGVLSSDSRLQIPEFLGTRKFNIDITQTAQTSSGQDSTPQSTVTAYSLTGNKGHIFTKSFTEHGYLIIVGSVRVAHRTYCQGLNKLWTRSSRFDFYFPELAHIGEQPVYNKEIYLQQVSSQQNGQVFGYQEAWAPYKYFPNMATGLMRTNINQNLSVWNYADHYDTLPTLSAEWIMEDKTNIDRSLAIPSGENQPQFLGDFYFVNKSTRPMPLHSVPGLIDHSAAFRW